MARSKREEVLEKVKDPEKLVLENRTIKIEPIFRDKSFFKKDHDGNHTYSGCWRHYCLPISLKTNSYFNPFKTKDEQYAFEDLLGLEEGDLNTTNRRSKFWGEFKIRLDKAGRSLDLSQVNDALIYRVMSVHPSFAKQDDDINIIEFEYQLVDERYVEEKINKLAAKKRKAYKELDKLSDSKQKMIDILRLMNIRLSENVKIGTLENKISEIIEQVEKLPGEKGKNIDDFLNAVNDPQAIAKLFVFDAIEAGEVFLKNGEYRLAENNELIAKSLSGTVDWFNDKANQESKLLIENRLENR